MKRTLVEVSIGLAGLVVMVSMHQQITRIDGRTQEVLDLREQVQSAVAKVTDTAADSRRNDELGAMHQRLQSLLLLRDWDFRIGKKLLSRWLNFKDAC